MRLLLLLTLALPGPLVRADVFAEYSLTGTVATSTIAGIHSGDQWSGTLETFDNCTLCDAANLDFDFAINAFGHHYLPHAADSLADVIFDTVALTLQFGESDNPVFSLTGHSFSYRPTFQDTADRVSGTVNIALAPEPGSILLLLTAIALLALIARRKVCA